MKPYENELLIVISAVESGVRFIQIRKLTTFYSVGLADYYA